MNRLDYVLPLLFVAALAIPVPAQELDARKRLEREGLIVQYAYGDVVVASVVRVFDKFINPVQPPIVFLQVHTVLRGEPKTSRVRAEWREPPFPFCGNGFLQAQQNMLLIQTLNRPNVGEKWILWGQADQPGGLFRVRTEVNMRHSPENEKKAKQLIVDAAKAKEEWDAEQAAARQKLQAAKDAWRARVNNKDLATLVKQADFVGVGKIVSDQGPIFQITQIIKGQKRIKYDGDEYYVSFSIDKALLPLLDRETTYVVLLTEKETPKQAFRIAYAPVPGSDGLIIADDAALRVLRGVK